MEADDLLYEACIRKDTEMARTVIANHADINFLRAEEIRPGLAYRGVTPLMFALRVQRHVDTGELFIAPRALIRFLVEEAGANVNVADHTGRTALVIARQEAAQFPQQREYFNEIFEILLTAQGENADRVAHAVFMNRFPAAQQRVTEGEQACHRLPNLLRRVQEQRRLNNRMPAILEELGRLR
ncbi:MAG: hypothetical protein WCK49_03255 [Myxococcaceae bacterium]